MTNIPANSEKRWDRGWKEHKERQLRRLAALPFSQKLEWLEEAHRLANVLHDQRADDTPSRQH